MVISRKQSLLQLDRAHVWHPFTQAKDYAEREPLVIDRAEGMFLYDADGNRYYDTNSSWWINVHGHGHPRIKAAIGRQLDKMDHVMFSGLTHEPGIELAARLAKLAPPGLTRVFYSDNGSTAVEVALKMSFQYWQQTGHPTKTKFVYVENSYHGDTIGAVSVGGVDAYFNVFRPLLFQAIMVPSPNPYRQPSRLNARDSRRIAAEQGLTAVQALFESSGDTIAAMIVEPMIQAAGGMIVYDPLYLQGLRELCDRHNIHLIADEVAVGFGRTGKMFGCEHAGISPDLMCLSKGLTAGVIPMSATLATEDIYMAFYDDYAKLKTFTHGHSFTGNPIAAAIALESLAIFEEERLLERTAEHADIVSSVIEAFGERPHIAHPRSLGMVGAFDLVADKQSLERFPRTARTGFQVYEAGLQEGLLLRPLDDTIYYWLPLCATESDIRDIAARTERVLNKLGL